MLYRQSATRVRPVFLAKSQAAFRQTIRSETSIIFGKGVTSAKPGSIDQLVLAVSDVDAARKDVIARGVDVSDVFHYAGGPFNNAEKNPRVGGRP